MEVLGLVFTESGTGKKLAYFTDCKSVHAEARALAEGADVVVLDACGLSHIHLICRSRKLVRSLER